jgi:hypothetical protein
MKYGSLLKSGVGVVLLAGALSPVLAAAGDEHTKWSYREGALYDNLRNAPSPDMITATAPRGAQGPIRTDSVAEKSMTTDKVFREGDLLVDGLRNEQASSGVPSAKVQGAQGPIRTESMDATWSYADGALYDNLREFTSH